MPQQPEILTRRQALGKAAAAAVAFQIVPAHVVRGGDAAPSNQITRAVIGTGGMGQGHVFKMNYGPLLAICDVDQLRLNNTHQRCDKNQTKAYVDFREVLARPDIDVVHVPTPPHWHGLISIAAAEAGKDVWCEKPLTRTIGEGQRVIEAIRRNNRVLRINTWFRFEGVFYKFGTTVKEIKKAVLSGELGWPLTATISGHTGFDWKFYWSGRANQREEKVPGNLNYDMWLGPAPYKPYTRHRTHGTFRGYWDYDGGGLGDMGQHYIDPVQYLLGKDDESPRYVEIEAPPQHPDAVGGWSRITYTYADGCKIILDGAGRDRGAPFLAGPKGKLYRGMESDIPGFRRKIAKLPDPPPQVTDFATSVRTREKFALNEVNGHRSCTLINIGKIALRLNRSLEFDGKTMRFVNDAQANRLADPPMRAPWSLTGGAV